MLVPLVCGIALGASMPRTARAETQGEAIVAVAATEAGLPYCFDGGGPSGPTHGVGGPGCEGGTIGFDCTGLTLFAVYQVTHKVLSHDGRQATEGGQIIAHESELLPGDLVFFGGTLNSFEHAGVYAGGGKIWDALNYHKPVQLHTFAQVGLRFVGGARYWSGNVGPPPNGSFVSYQGNVYRIAGGAPIYINSWAPFGGPQPTIPLSAGQWSALPQMPANETTISGAETGQVYKIAGGAPLYLNSCDAGCGSPVAVSQYAIEHNGTPPGGPWHLNGVPAEGTTLGTPSSETGRIYKVAGGAPLYLNSCDAGCGSPVEVNQYTIDANGAPPGGVRHLNTVPMNGVFLRGADSERVYRVAGGTPIYVTDCAALGFPGCDMPLVSVMQYTIGNLGAPTGGVTHLSAVPANGTIVEGLPSSTYWSFSGGLRSRAAADSGAVAVDDFGLAAFPEDSPAPGTPSGPLATHTESPAQIHVRVATGAGAPRRMTSNHRLAAALASCRRLKSRKRRAACKTKARHRSSAKFGAPVTGLPGASLPTRGPRTGMGGRCAPRWRSGLLGSATRRVGSR